MCVLAVCCRTLLFILHSHHRHDKRGVGEWGGQNGFTNWVLQGGRCHWLILIKFCDWVPLLLSVTLPLSVSQFVFYLPIYLFITVSMSLGSVEGLTSCQKAAKARTTTNTTVSGAKQNSKVYSRRCRERDRTGRAPPPGCVGRKGFIISFLISQVIWHFAEL